MTKRLSLPLLDDRIEARARATREAHPWWPCGDGCDGCCRSLPHLPVITEAEWSRLRPALLALPPDVRVDIAARTRSASASKPVTCPMLDEEQHRCRVYDARPIACRTYGFYAERDGGLHCAIVTEAVDAHGTASEVLWGNGGAIAEDMRAFGDVASLLRWMATLEGA
jgi:Fe-S-cluster containining protein